MRQISLSNLLCNWDIDLLKVIEHLKKGMPDSALIKCEEMHKTIVKMKPHCKDCDMRIVDDI